MATWKADEAPAPHYVVSVQIKEIVPSHILGGRAVDRVVQDTVSVTITGKTKDGAILSAVAHLSNEYDIVLEEGEGDPFKDRLEC